MLKGVISLRRNETGRQIRKMHCTLITRPLKIETWRQLNISSSCEFYFKVMKKILCGDDLKTNEPV